MGLSSGRESSHWRNSGALRSLRPLPVRKVEFYLGDLAQRMCPLMPSSKDFVHKVPHLFFDLVQCNGRRDGIPSSDQTKQKIPRNMWRAASRR